MKRWKSSTSRLLPGIAVRWFQWVLDSMKTVDYVASPRGYPAQLPPLEYPGHFLVKKITTGGTFRFQSRLLFVAKPQTGNHVGRRCVPIYFNMILLATFDERDYVIQE